MDTFESIKGLTVASAYAYHPPPVTRLSHPYTLDSMTHLYAFNYTPSRPLSISDGWNLYSPREEFGRMGVGTRSKAWRFTDIHKDYTVRSHPPM